MILKLKVTDGSNAGKEIIVNKDKFLIGRADECGLRPHSDAISRRHCVIIKSDKVVGVRDLKSRNGTIVNGEKITGDKRLRNGDKLEVGPLKFEVVIEKTAAVEKPAAKKSPATAAQTGGMADMVSDWLEEADDVAKAEQRLNANETREYRFDETSKIEVSKDDEETSTKETKEIKADKKDKKDKDKEEPGKLPKFEVKKEQPKDSREAAQQVLRKLFNRN